MAERLTNSIVNNLEPRQARYEVSDTEVKGLRVRVSPKGDKSYYILYQHNGQRRRYRLGRHGELTIAQARKLALARLGEVAAGTDIQVERKESRVQAEKDKAASLGAFLERHYWPHVEAEHKRGDITRSIIEREFRHLLDRHLDEITPLTMTRWRKDRLVAGIDAATLNRARGALSGVLSRAVEWGYLARHPFGNRQFRKLTEDKSGGNVRFLSEDEEKRLRLGLQDRDAKIRASRINNNQWRTKRGHDPLPEFTGRYVDHLEPLILTLRLTGLRPKEAFALDWRHVDLERGMITVVGITTKTAQTRHVPMSGELQSILKDWAAQIGTDGLVFPGSNRKHLRSINKGWSNVRDAAHLADFRLYDLRHSFASSLVMAGVDLLTVKELLGHTTYEMTLKYAHLAPDHKRQAVTALDRLEVA